MPLSQEVKRQLRLLGDLRDVLEKYLAIARGPADAGAAVREDHVRRISDMLIDIQMRRNRLLLHQAAAAGQMVRAELDASRAMLESSIDVLKRMSALYPPFYSPLQDFLANAEAYVTQPSASAGT